MFEVYIYKDRDQQYMISKLAEGSRIMAEVLLAGKLDAIKMFPDDYSVQTKTDLEVVFTTTHALNAEAAVTIRLPAGLNPEGSVGSVLPVSSPDGSTSANFGVVLAGNMVQIQNLVPANGVKVDEGSTFRVKIQNIVNQNSAKDAGDFTITTQNKIGDDFYTVDQQTSEESFVATPGLITADGDIVISNPTNDAKSNIYTMTFILTDKVPSAGYIQV